MKLRNLLVSLGLSLILGGGCTLLPPSPEETRFYLLTAIARPAPTQPQPSATGQLAIGLGPVKFPDYLEHLEVVTRVSPNRIVLSSTDRWAEPLDDSFKRVLARNLTTLLGTNQVVQFPWYSSVSLDYQVELSVDRFESDGSGAAQLVASWLIRDAHSGKTLLAQQSNLTAGAETQGPGAQNGSAGASIESAAAALSTDLGALSKQIADAITELSLARRNRPAS
jgi:uncharacterized lipoprotein YmbA